MCLIILFFVHLLEKNSIVDKKNLIEVIAKLDKNYEGNSLTQGNSAISVKTFDVRKYLHVLNAIETPNYYYDIHDKKFLKLII